MYLSANAAGAMQPRLGSRNGLTPIGRGTACLGGSLREIRATGARRNECLHCPRGALRAANRRSAGGKPEAAPWSQDPPATQGRHDQDRTVNIPDLGRPYITYQGEVLPDRRLQPSDS